MDRPFPHAPVRIARATSALACVLAMACATLGATSGSAATGGTVVGATVPSATAIGMTTCGSFVAGATDFGSITPGSQLATSIDCSVRFGSSNDTSQLRMMQSDGVGLGMWAPSVGLLDAGYDGPSGTANGAFSLTVGTNADRALAAATQLDGKVVVAGRCDGPTDTDACVARLLADGSLDPAFDGPGAPGNGRFLLSAGSGYDTMQALAIQPDGKLVLAGGCQGPSDTDLCVARLTSTGALDTTFGGGDGFAIVAKGGGGDTAFAIALAPDGRIVVGGQCWSGGTMEFCLARLESNGSLDVTFDGPSGTGDGLFVDSLTAGSDWLVGVALQADGRVVALGYCPGVADWDLCLGRYDVDGKRDVAFDGPSGSANGAFLYSFSAQDDQQSAVALQPDGKIVTLGLCVSGDYRFCFARFNTDGSFDTSFDGPSGTGNGRFILPPVYGREFGRALLVDDQGMLVAGGTCSNGAYDPCMVRLRPDGSFDATFDGSSGTGNGRVVVPYGALDDEGLAVTAQPDGSIAMAGTCTNATLDMCVSSFDGAGGIDDYVTGGGSDRDWASGAGTSFFATCLRAVSGGATAAWTTSDPCPTSDGAFWRAVPTTSTKVAYNLGLEPDPADATAHLRFAMRAASSQPPGTYIAPIAFEVLAPNA